MRVSSTAHTAPLISTCRADAAERMRTTHRLPDDVSEEDEHIETMIKKYPSLISGWDSEHQEFIFKSDTAERAFKTVVAFIQDAHKTIGEGWASGRMPDDIYYPARGRVHLFID